MRCWRIHLDWWEDSPIYRINLTIYIIQMKSTWKKTFHLDHIRDLLHIDQTTAKGGTECQLLTQCRVVQVDLHESWSAQIQNTETENENSCSPNAESSKSTYMCLHRCKCRYRKWKWKQLLTQCRVVQVDLHACVTWQMPNTKYHDKNSCHQKPSRRSRLPWLYNGANAEYRKRKWNLLTPNA